MLPRRRAARLLPLCVAAAAAPAPARRCAMLHGSGLSRVAPPTPDDTDNYWGGLAGVQRFTGGLCTEWAFAHGDTNSLGWDDEATQRRFCDAATGGGSVVRDTVVITHSAGNLLFAEGLRKGFCSMGGSAAWVSLSAPWRGSKAADWLSNLCANPTGFGEPLHWLAQQLGYCNGTVPTGSNMALRTTHPGFAAAAAVGAQHVSYALCGTSPTGIVQHAKTAAGLKALSVAVGYGEDNDGMVGISSCQIPGRSYAADWREPWYSAAVNHADGTLRNGDGVKLLGDAKQPGEWLAARAAGMPPLPPPPPEWSEASAALPSGGAAAAGKSWAAPVLNGSSPVAVALREVTFTMGVKGCTPGEQHFTVAAVCDGAAAWRSPALLADSDAPVVVLGGAAPMRCSAFGVAIRNGNKHCRETYAGAAVRYATGAAAAAAP